MSQILMGRPTDAQMNWRTLHGMFRLRDTVFHKELGWEVQSDQGLERDYYDDLAPVYIISRTPSRRIEACARLLPTTGSYMLKDTFPELLRGEPAPRDPNIWELSRLAAKPEHNDECRQFNFRQPTLQMLQRAVDFAGQHGIRSCVVVTSVALERLLLKLGIPLRRFGDKKAQKIGKVLSVACWIDINDQCCRAIQQSIELGQEERRAA